MGRMDSPARAYLRAWIDQQAPTPPEGRGAPKRGACQLAAKLGVSRSTVYSWLRGVSTPAPDIRDSLERLTGCPASGWPTVRVGRPPKGRA
jgi:transcriptional regulator with XRE-family HTH domain